MKLLYIDLFCGAGGTSTGVNAARLDGEKCADVIACVNHDANAIASHASNHPEALHFTEDIRTLELSPLVAHTAVKRAENPDAFVVLWASLECTNFSKAKGGMPRDADSRTLAEHLFRYIEAINPDYIQIENVEEFMSWGDMDENGKPLSMDRGRLYRRWVNNVKKYGYHFESRILNSADYGAYTSRKRFFGIFAKKGLPIVFPVPTHSKEPQKTLLNDLKRWKPVKDVLDLEDEGLSIFARKKALSEKTLERIYAGLVKFVAGGKDAFLVKWNSMNRKGIYHAPSIDEPCPTLTTKDRLSLITSQFLDMQYGNGTPASIEVPANTVTTNPKFNLVTVKPCKSYYQMNPQTETGDVAINVYDTDTPMTVKIKEFMALYGIVDIKMRMLNIHELKRIMGFPDSYVLVGTQADQKKFIGNAVEVNMARVLCEALCRSLKALNINPKNIAA